MPVTFSVLASSSRGNSMLLRSSSTALMIDLGLGPRTLERRLHVVGSNLDAVGSVLLTHTHGDHVRNPSLHAIARRGIQMVVHEGHLPTLRRLDGFHELDRRKLVRTFDDRPFLLSNGARAEPIPLSHDGGPTFGFRLEFKDRRRGRPITVGFVTDTGTWEEATAEALADSDLLALEFNHDVELQRRSNRSSALIARNLGTRGHLSNDQGAELLAATLQRSRPGAVRHVVLLHLSEQCNRPELALREARDAAQSCGRRLNIEAARHHLPNPDIQLRPRRIPPVVETPRLFPWEAA